VPPFHAASRHFVAPPLLHLLTHDSRGQDMKRVFAVVSTLTRTEREIVRMIGKRERYAQVAHSHMTQ